MTYGANWCIVGIKVHFDKYDINFYLIWDLSLTHNNGSEGKVRTDSIFIS